MFIRQFELGVRLGSDHLRNFSSVPGKNHIPETYFGDTRLGYNIEYFNKNEIIADVLKQYERFVELSSEVKNEIFTDNTLKESQ